MRTQTNMAQMKEKNKTPEREVNEMEINNLSDAQFKTLVIRMLQELIGYFSAIKKAETEMEVALSEINICREPIVEKIKLRIKSTIWNTRKEKALEQQEEKDSKKKKEKGQAQEPLGQL